jgi:hypothetical protein
VIDGRSVKHAQAIPKNVTFGRLQKEGTLADAEVGLNIERCQKALLQNDVDAVAAAQIFERGPFLTVETDELAVVAANGTTIGRNGRFLKLGAAGGADRSHP